MRLMPKLYQKEALKSIVNTKQSMGNSAIIQMASGLGKTYFAAFESLNYSGRILFICHRKEILEQSKRVFEKIYQDHSRRILKYGFFHGTIKQPKRNLLFASISCLSRDNNLKSFEKNAFDLIIIDEFHHSLASSYKKVIDYFEPKFWLGITATPYRLDDPEGEKLQELFNSKVIFEYNLAKAIDNQDLCPFTLIFHKDNIDYSKIKFQGNKYSEKDLNRVLLIEERDTAVINEYKRYFINRKCIGFCVSIDHVERMVELFKRNGVSVEGITYRTGIDERRRIEKDFRVGNIKVLFTRDIYNEGVDIPDIDGVILLRPTISKVIFFQQIGRGLRKSSMKKDLMILDFVGNYKNVYMHHEWLSKPLDTGMVREGKPEYEYPLGCKVIFNKEIIDLFEMMKEAAIPATKEDLIQNYYFMKKKLGKQPISNDMYINKGSKYSIYRYTYSFGSWNKFLKTINEPILADYELVSEDDLIQNYYFMKKKLGKQPRSEDIIMKKGSKYSINTYKLIFGSWNKFLKTIKEPIVFTVSYNKGLVIKNDLIQNYYFMKKKLGKQPISIDMVMKKGSKYGQYIYMRIFGSWIKFLKTINEPILANHDSVSEDDLIQNYYFMKKKLGKQPKSTDINIKKGSKYGSHKYVCAFGSWNKFLKTINEPILADYELVSEDDLIQNYYFMKKKLGKQPKSTDMAMKKGSKYGHHRYVKSFGSWNKFLKTINEPIRKGVGD